VYEFTVQCNTEDFCCGNPYKKEFLLKVSLIVKLIIRYFSSFKINIVSAGGEIFNKLSFERRNEREHSVFTLKIRMKLECVQKRVHENL
jgi:hypothetical protein